MTKEIYQKSVDILLDAYNDGRLFHGKCDACAVGNLVGSYEWVYVIGEYDHYAAKHCDLKVRRETSQDYINGCELISKNGFTRNELTIIETAFESSIANSEEGYDWFAYDDKKQGQYIGLCAVLDVMKDMVEEEVPFKENQERLELIYASVK